MAAAMNEPLYRSKSDEDRKEKFFVWLAAKVSPAQLSELYDNQHRIDQFCLPRNLLEKPLFQNGDANTIQKLVKGLKKSLPFKLQKNVGLLFSILNYYVQYLQELEKERSIQTSQDPLIQALRHDGLAIIDRRGFNGCLWVIAGEEKAEYFAKWNNRGVFFSFELNGSVATGNRAAWWTRFQGKTLPLTHAEMETIQEKKPVQDAPSISQEDQHAPLNAQPVESSPVYETGVTEEHEEVRQNTFIQDQQESLIQSISGRGLEYIDNRGKGGCLWVICGREESSFFQKWSKNGIHFYFASGGRKATKYRPAWWTTDALESERIRQPENINKKEQSETSQTDITEKKQEESTDAEQQMFGSNIQHEKDIGTTDNNRVERNASDSAAEMQTMLPTPVASEQGTSEETNKENRDIPSDQAIDEIPKADNKQKKAHTESEAVKEEQNQKQKVASTEKMSEELWDFLSDAKYDLLRAVLDQKKIWTIDQLASVDLWQLLYNNNLYSLEKRIEIYREVEAKLEDEMVIPEPDKEQAAEDTAPIDKSFILSVAGKEYNGSTPSIAFSKLCIYLANNYPDSFPSVQNLPYNGVGPIVITKRRRRGKIWVGPPRGYIEPDLSSKDVAGYSQWLCRFCGAPWRPVVLKELQNTQVVRKQTKPNQAPTVPSNDTEQVSKEKADTSLQKKESSWVRDIRWVEETLLSSGMRGMTIQELSNEILRSKESTEKMVLSSQKIIALPDRLIHESAMDEYPDIKEEIKAILEELSKYEAISPALLYLRVFASMPQLLMDQHLDSKEAIFAIARHFWPQLLKENAKQPTKEENAEPAPISSASTEKADNKPNEEFEKAAPANESEGKHSSPETLPLPDGEISESTLIGWQEVKPKLKSIWENLLQSNKGKVSPSLLYLHVFSSMADFLRENKLNNKESVYAIVQYLWPAESSASRLDTPSAAPTVSTPPEKNQQEKTEKALSETRKTELPPVTVETKKQSAKNDKEIVKEESSVVDDQDSWGIVDDHTVFKICDSVLFSRRRTMIPPPLYLFFNVEHLDTMGSRRIIFKYHSIRNTAYIFRDSPGDAGIRLSWYSAKMGKQLEKYRNVPNVKVQFVKLSNDIYEISLYADGQRIDQEDASKTLSLHADVTEQGDSHKDAVTEDERATAQSSKAVITENKEKQTGNKIRGTFDSWEIVDEKTAIKKCDKFFFLYNDFGIPKEVQSFFGIKTMPPRGQKQITLIYLSKMYRAYLAKDAYTASARIYLAGNVLPSMLQEYKNISSAKAVFHKRSEDEYLLEMRTDRQEDSPVIPGKYGYWEIKDQDTAVLTCDNDCFMDREAELPDVLLTFFGVEALKEYEFKKITLNYLFEDYPVSIYRSTGSKQKAFLSWQNSSLGDEWDEYGDVVLQTSVKARFRRKDDGTFAVALLTSADKQEYGYQLPKSAIVNAPQPELHASESAVKNDIPDASPAAEKQSIAAPIRIKTPSFEKWLESKVEHRTALSFYNSRYALAVYCKSNRLIKTPIFEVKDIDTLTALQKRLERDNTFLKDPRSLQMLSLLKYFITYVFEISRINDGFLPNANVALPVNAENRAPAPQKEIQSERANILQQEPQKEQNVKEHQEPEAAEEPEKTEQPQTPSIPLVKASIPVRASASPQHILDPKAPASIGDWEKDMRDAFYEWLKKKEASSATAMGIYISMRTLNKLAQQNAKFRNSLYSIQTIEELLIAKSILEQDPAFVQELSKCRRDGYDPLLRFQVFFPSYLRSLIKMKREKTAAKATQRQTPSPVLSVVLQTAKETNTVQIFPLEDTSAKNTGLIQQVEKLVLQSDLAGISAEELAKACYEPKTAIQKAIQDSVAIVSIEGRLIHQDAFVDWEHGADQLEAILDKLLDKNDGYVSAAQLYEYARTEMQMFLNDNDMDAPRRVYDMAEHLFSKVGYHDKYFTFWMKNHISRQNAAVTSMLDVIMNYAREQGGRFHEEELIAYLESVKLKTGNLRGIMKVYEKPIFFFYDDHAYITAESMGMDQAWFDAVKRALQQLFADVGDHVVIRDIQPWWYSLLPALPGGTAWTALLLQSVLRFYSDTLGARTIGGLDSHAGDTLHAMLAKTDSEVQTFADAVISVLLEDGIAQRSFETEELRQLLVRRGLIAGNELIGKMPKALPPDERFIWDAAQEHVMIKV